MPNYIDTHAHLFYKDYKDDLDDVIKRAQQNGVNYCIIPATDLSTSIEAIKIAEKYSNVYACIGIHPHDSKNVKDKDIYEIEKLCNHPKVVAVGEIGLDYHYDFSPKDIQIKIFTELLHVAIKNQLPVVIHTRESFDDAFGIIQNIINDGKWLNNAKRGVFHCFPESSEKALLLSNLGFFVSYTGLVTFKKSYAINKIKEIGIKNILLETDSPYMSPEPLRGKRNEPANISIIAKKISEQLLISESLLADITTQNALELFSKINVNA